MIVQPPVMDPAQRRRGRVCHVLGVLGLVVVGVATPLQALWLLGIVMGGADTHTAPETMGRLVAEWLGAGLGLGLLLCSSIWLVGRLSRPVPRSAMRAVLALYLAGLLAAAAGEALLARTAAGAEQAKGATSVAPSTSPRTCRIPPDTPPWYCIPPDVFPRGTSSSAPRSVSLTGET